MNYRRHNLKRYQLLSTSLASRSTLPRLYIMNKKYESRSHA